MNQNTSLKFYGLKTCDTCRKALSALEGREVTVVDVRADRVPRAMLEGWIAELGPEGLVNRKSTTWRGLDAADQAKAATAEGAVELLAAHPTLMKRPVIVTEGAVHVGWGPEVRAALGA